LDAVVLAVRDIRVGYRNNRLVLSDLGFTIGRGRILTILGPNGVGKTTLLRCLNAMIRPWAGRVLVDNGDIFQMTPAQIARRVGYVAQRNEAGRMTAFDAVLLGRIPHLRWRVAESDLAKVDAVLGQVGLRHLALRQLGEMSGGELQKVCIARAWCRNPRCSCWMNPRAAWILKIG